MYLLADKKRLLTGDGSYRRHFDIVKADLAVVKGTLNSGLAEFRAGRQKRSFQLCSWRSENKGYSLVRLRGIEFLLGLFKCNG